MRKWLVKEYNNLQRHVFFIYLDPLVIVVNSVGTSLGDIPDDVVRGNEIGHSIYSNSIGKRSFLFAAGFVKIKSLDGFTGI